MVEWLKIRFKAIFAPTPLVGEMYVHRAIGNDLYFQVTGHYLGSPIITYGLPVDGVFEPLLNRPSRIISKYRLHVQYKKS